MKRARVVLVAGFVLATAGCNGILGLDPSTLSADAEPSNTETPDGTTTPGDEAGSPNGSDGGGDTGPDASTATDAAATGTPDSSTGTQGANDAGGDGGCESTCTGTCTDGRCVIILASASPEDLALMGADVYYTDYIAGTVMSVPTAGGQTTTLASGQDTPGSIVTDGTYVYWATTSAVSKMIPPAGPIATLASSVSPTTIVVDGANVYWTDFNDGKVLRAPLSGSGIVTPIDTGASAQYANGIAVTDTSVYWTDFDDDTTMCTVEKAALDGGAATAIATGQNSAEYVLVYGDRVYWTNDGYGPGTGSVMSSLLDGTDPVPIATNQDAPYGIAVDGTSIYWTNEEGVFGGNTGGNIMKAPLDGGAPTTLLGAQDNPGFIAVDSTSVYWTTPNDVRKLTPK
jgi:uncharacterized protein DUF5050